MSSELIVFPIDARTSGKYTQRYVCLQDKEFGFVLPSGSLNRYRGGDTNPWGMFAALGCDSYRRIG